MESGSSWFTGAQVEALKDFWRVYEARYDEVLAGTMRELVEHPRLGPMMRAMAEEQRPEQNRASRERLRRAIEGEWEAYEQNLRQQGKLYAVSEISFSEWYDIFRAFTRYLT